MQPVRCRQAAACQFIKRNLRKHPSRMHSASLGVSSPTTWSISCTALARASGDCMSWNRVQVSTAAVVSCPAINMVMRSSRSCLSSMSASRKSTMNRSRLGSFTCIHIVRLILGGQESGGGGGGHEGHAAQDFGSFTCVNTVRLIQGGQGDGGWAQGHAVVNLGL